MEDKPTSISEVDFFTRQIMEPNGFAFMWVFKPMCPECGKARLVKIKKRDKVYTCIECKKTFEKSEYNSLLKANLEYTCPNCEHKGKLFTDWKKPEKKSSVTVLKFVCESCGSKLKVARMKKQKKKKKK